MRALLFCFALSPCVALAQESSGKPALKPLPFTLKTAPLNLINGVQISADLLADIPINPIWAIEIGIGVLLDSETYAKYAGETYRGVKVKPTVKYFIDRTGDEDLYIGLALKYNYIQNERYLRMFRQGQQYLETSLQQRRVQTFGAAFRVGAQWYSGKRDRFVFDPSMSFGFRHSQVAYPKLPPDAEPTTLSGWNLARVPGQRWTLDVMLGLSIGVKL